MNKEQIIKELFEDPALGLQSADKLFLKLRNKGITKQEIKDFFSKALNKTSL